MDKMTTTSTRYRLIVLTVLVTLLRAVSAILETSMQPSRVFGIQKDIHKVIEEACSLIDDIKAEQ